MDRFLPSLHSRDEWKWQSYCGMDLSGGGVENWRAYTIGMGHIHTENHPLRKCLGNTN